MPSLGERERGLNNMLQVVIELNIQELALHFSFSCIDITSTSI